MESYYKAENKRIVEALGRMGVDVGGETADDIINALPKIKPNWQSKHVECNPYGTYDDDSTPTITFNTGVYGKTLWKDMFVRMDAIYGGAWFKAFSYTYNPSNGVVTINCGDNNFNSWTGWLNQITVYYN